MYQDEFSRYLTKKTGAGWHQVPDLYVNYKQSMSPTGNICVVTPDVYPRQEKMCRFYMPKENQHIYHPSLFVKKLLNAKNNLAKAMPWIKLDIDQFPKIEHTARVLLPLGLVEIKYKISLSGDIKMKKFGSLSNQTLGVSSFHNIAYNAKEEFWGIAHTLKGHFNPMNMTVSLGESVTGPLGTTSFKLSNDGGVEAEFTPRNFVQHFQYRGWQYETHLSYKISGKYTQVNAEPPPQTSRLQEVKKVLEYTGLGALAAIVFFATGGTAAGPEAVAFGALTL